MNKTYDAIVIGAGHAGVESACTLSKLGKKTLLMALSLNAISFMACNPNIGGTAKGHLVREIDALGGELGLVADMATIQTRLLNRGNGPAVHSLRAQVDKDLFHRLQKQRIENMQNLSIIETEAKEILIKENRAIGVKTIMGDTYFAKSVIVASGVYLNAKIIIGAYQEASGPSGYKRSTYLADNLKELGLDIRRFKTGTPARVLRASLDFDKMEPQRGDIGIPKFSYMTDIDICNSEICYLTYTNENTHNIILDNLDKAPLYNGSIDGVGPRYCPSIEDKIVRFKDKPRHQIFIEPEGLDTDEMYVQGLSTSMPYDIQEKMIHSIRGLEDAVITRYGYAIEYDCVDPLNLLPTLETKKIKGLYMAGQINGSSGYEEAAAQGLIAGINAAFYIDEKPPFILKRSEAYIGVLIDDLVTKGTNEPYRMMTSRAEYRLNLRQDNADERLTEIGYQIGLVKESRYNRFKEKQKTKEEIREKLSSVYSPKLVNPYLFNTDKGEIKAGVTGEYLLKRSDFTFENLISLDETFKKYDSSFLQEIEIEIKYSGYIKKQQKEIQEQQKMEKKRLSPDIDYSKIEGLRLEARQKLNHIKPLDLAQASRISGVTPSDITVLIIFLHKQKKGDN